MSTLSNLSSNLTSLFNALNGGQPIAISLSQSTNPWQFAINCGVVLVSGIGILAVPMILSGGKPIKKAKSIKEFSRITGRPTIIIDHSRQRLFKPAMIDKKTVTDIIRAMNRIGGKDFNLVLNSGGGEVFSSQLISDVMQKYPGNIEIYVPKYSMSGATLLALSGKRIHMTPYSSLGMLDAQIGTFLTSGSAKGWETVVEMKGSKANDNSILHNITGKQVTQSLRENIFNVIQGKTNKPEEVVDYLTSGKHEHIKQIKINKLLELGFNNICNISPQEERLLCNMVD